MSQDPELEPELQDQPKSESSTESLQQDSTRLEGAALAKFVADRCAEKRGRDVAILDMTRALGLTDYFVLCSANSDRQARIIARFCDEQIKALGAWRAPPLEGFNTGNWICADFGEVMLHVFTADQRDFYDLDHIWGDVPRIAWEAPPEFYARADLGNAEFDEGYDPDLDEPENKRFFGASRHIPGDDTADEDLLSEAERRALDDDS